MKYIVKNIKKNKPKKIIFFKKLNYSLLDYNFFSSTFLKKKHFETYKNISVKFNNSFIKHGLALKGLNIVNKSFSNFYNLFFLKNNNIIFFKKYQDFLIFSKSDNNFFRRLFILNRMVELLSSPFFLKVEKISKKLKKLKKNSKIKYKYKVTYMPSLQRTNYITKQFLIYVNTLKYFDINTRLTESLYNLILEDKDSELYKQKINIIRKFKNS